MQRYIGEHGVVKVRASHAFTVAIQRGNLPRALDIEAEQRGFLDWFQYAREWPKMSAKVRAQIEQQILNRQRSAS